MIQIQIRYDKPEEQKEAELYQSWILALQITDKVPVVVVPKEGSRRSETEIREELQRIDTMIEGHRKEGKRVGGAQYTIAKTLRWVLGEDA